MRQLFALLFAFIFLSCFAQDKNTPVRPDTYNYRRGMEALQNRNNEEALEFLNKEIEENPSLFNGQVMDLFVIRLYKCVSCGKWIIDILE